MVNPVKRLNSKSGLLVESDLLTTDASLVKQQAIQHIGQMTRNQEYSGYVLSMVNKCIAHVKVNHFAEGLVMLMDGQSVKTQQVIRFKVSFLDQKKSTFSALQVVQDVDLESVFQSQPSQTHFSVGMVLQAKVSLKKQYGLILDMPE